MRTIHDPILKANLTIDESGHIRGINHLERYHDLEYGQGSDTPTTYVRSIGEKLKIAPEELNNLDQPVSYVDPQRQGVEYRFSEKKEMFDSATYAYYQTYLNTPVWAAGITVTVNQAPAGITGSTNTTEHGIDAEMPSAEAIERYRQLFATGEKVDEVIMGCVVQAGIGQAPG